VIEIVEKKPFPLYLSIQVYRQMKEETGNVSAWVENAMIDFLNSKEPISESKVIEKEQEANNASEEAAVLRRNLEEQNKYSVLAAEQAKVSMANQERLEKVAFWYRKIDILRKKHPQAVSSFSMALGYSNPGLKPRTNPTDTETLYNYLNDNLRRKPKDVIENSEENALPTP